MHDLLTRSAPPTSREDVLRISESHLQEMKQLCATHGTHFIYLLPPGFDVREDAIVDAAARADASLLVPVHSDAWPKSKFSDGFHLSEAGAREFTQILSPSLYAI